MILLVAWLFVTSRYLDSCLCTLFASHYCQQDIKRAPLVSRLVVLMFDEDKCMFLSIPGTTDGKGLCYSSWEWKSVLHRIYHKEYNLDPKSAFELFNANNWDSTNSYRATWNIKRLRLLVANVLFWKEIDKFIEWVKTETAVLQANWSSKYYL